MNYGAIERITPRHVTGNQIRDIWMRRAKAFESSREAIKLCRRLYAGKLRLSLPDEFRLANSENLAIGMPQKTTLPLRLTAILQQRQPRLRREPTGTSPAVLNRASRIETWDNAVVEKLDIWNDSVDRLLNEGECAVIVAPSAAHWEDLPDYLDVIDLEAYQKLSDSQKGTYKSYKSENGQNHSYARMDGDSKPLPKRVYQRDSADRLPEDDGFTGSDDGTSAKAYRAEMQDFLARTLPLTARIVPADDCIPIYGPGLKLEALLVRSTFTREQLIERRYVWANDPDGLTGNSLAIPAGGQPDNVYSSQPAADLTLYEYWGYCNGKPYVAYSVEGLPTYKVDSSGEQMADAVIDLYQECGLSKLPVDYVYGQHFRGANPDNPGAPLGIPFALPLIGVLLHRDMIVTGVAVKTWMSGFPGYFFKPDLELLQGAAGLGLENNIKKEIKVVPLQAQPIYGDIVPATSPPLGAEVGAILNLLANALAEEAPNPAAFGSGDANNARERALIEDQVRGSMSQVLKGALRIYSFVGSTALEIACYIGKTYRPVPVYANVKVTEGDRKPNAKTKQQLVVLDPDLVGPVYDVEAYYPREFGENLARSQMWIESWKDGATPFREMREQAFEDESPEDTLAELIVDKYIMGDGVAEILELAAQQVGDEQMAEKLRLKAQGQTTESGTPTGMLDGVPPQQMAPPPAAPMGPGGAPTVDMGEGLVGNPGLSSMAGTIGADMQAGAPTTSDQQNSAARGAPGGY